MDLGSCESLVSLPSSIYKLSNMEHLGLGRCTSLIGFPICEDSADPCMKTKLSNLLSLSIGGCKFSDIDFLDNPSCFPFLRHLILEESDVTGLPTSIHKRDRLSVFAISYCHQLQEIPELPPLFKHLLASNWESLQINGYTTPFSVFVRRVLTVGDIASLDQMPPDYTVWFPGEDMREWIIPIEGSSVSFEASEDLYGKFLGMILCAIFINDEQEKCPTYEILPYVNGEMRDCKGGKIMGSNPVQFLLMYFTPHDMWGEVDFGQIDGTHVRFSLTLSIAKVKKWGFRIICKQFDDELKVGIQDNQLIDPALLCEVALESTDLEVECALKHKESLMETNLRRDLQNCQSNNEDHSQIVSRGNPWLVLSHGMRTETMLTSNSTGRDRVGLQLLLLE